MPTYSIAVRLSSSFSWLQRAEHPSPVCMLSVAVGGRCNAIVSARRAVSRDSFRLRWLKLLALQAPTEVARKENSDPFSVISEKRDSEGRSLYSSAAVSDYTESTSAVVPLTKRPRT
jgi:hypothetical protein